MTVKGKHILVVDDEPLLVRLNKRQLENAGYTVSVSTASLEALEMLSKALGKYSLLLTDLTMPGLSGLELIRKVRLQLPDLPVIVLTGMSDPETEGHLYDLGVKDVVIKPLLEDELLAAVSKVLGGK
ncbi:MAG: CheY-like chemotaxis protein [Desulforhopalus sp.]|jgi:CheY-like chemotaxis protein